METSATGGRGGTVGRTLCKQRRWSTVKESSVEASTEQRTTEVVNKLLTEDRGQKTEDGRQKTEDRIWQQ